MIILQDIKPDNGTPDYQALFQKVVQQNFEKLDTVFRPALTEDITLAGVTTLEVKNGLIVGYS